MAPSSQQQPITVLFVCTANICRSPLAEALFCNLVDEAGLAGQVKADSAASGRQQVGSPPHPSVISVLETHGIDFNHTARPFTHEDLRTFDFVLGMDNEVLRSIWAIGSGPAKVQPFVKYTPQLKLEQVPDPIVTGDFDAAYSVILAGCQTFLAFLRQTCGL